MSTESTGSAFSSYPAQKSLPAPRRMTQWIVLSMSASLRASLSSDCRRAERALRFSGRLSVMRQRPSYLRGAEMRVRAADGAEGGADGERGGEPEPMEQGARSRLGDGAEPEQGKRTCRR